MSFWGEDAQSRARFVLREVKSRLETARSVLAEPPRDVGALAGLAIALDAVDDVLRSVTHARTPGSAPTFAQEPPKPAPWAETLRAYGGRLEREEAHRRREAERARLAGFRFMGSSLPAKTWSSSPGDEFTEEWSRLDLTYDEVHQDEDADGRLTHERVLVYASPEHPRRVVVRYPEAKMGEEAPQFVLARRIPPNVEFPRASDGPWTLADPLLSPEEG